MAKSNAERARACMMERRLRAREAGLCTKCFKTKPHPDRVICVACNVATSQRKKSRRRAMREASEESRKFLDHERAGDMARDHHFYDEAAEHYQRALNARTLSSEEQLRLSEKFSSVLILGSNPSASNPRVEQYVPQHLRNAAERMRAVHLLHNQLRNLSSGFMSDEAPFLATKAIRIAETIDDPQFRKIANIKMADVLSTLGRYDDARYHLRIVGDVGDGDDMAVRAYFYMEKAFLASAFGNATAAYKDFKRAVHAAGNLDDFYRVIAIWGNYGLCAMSLGNIDLAKTCVRRGLLLARQNQIMWRIPHLCLRYADLLIKTGKYTIAYDYLLEALSYEAHAPLLDGAFAQVGIPLALHMKDEATLRRCARPLTLRAAFRSRISDYIGPISAAFAQFYATLGNKRKARRLLHRALQFVHNADFSWDLLLEIGRRGALSDVPLARSLLVTRMSLPNHDVSAAFLSLFDAYVAQRHRKPEMIQLHGLEAVAQFEVLGWHAYADAARFLVPNGVQNERLTTSGRGKAFGGIRSALTARERQVAELALQGLSNRDIAVRLAISKHTVDSHISSIINRLGIQSRYQLAGALS